ncbi:MAG: NAD(P)-dependent oxidoreductase [Bacteroidota bacterium]
MKILVASEFPEAFLQKLRSQGLTVTYSPTKNPEELIPIIALYEVLIVRTFPTVRKELIDHAKSLKLLCRAGIGMDHIDVAYLEQKGIAVFNTKGANADSVGEQSVGMLLSLLHHISRGNQHVKAFQWKREANRGSELQSLTVGIIGYGHTGSAVAKRLAGFGCRILAYDKYKRDYGNEYVEEVSLAFLQLHSQILSFHVPLTDETMNWGNSTFFNQFTHPIYLLNLARGKVVHLPSLLQALESGKVLGAGLDVLPNERFDTLGEGERFLYERLFSKENVVLTPHVGGWSFESRENIQDAILMRILDFQKA